jgi:gliding motility-associated-like protein
MIKTFYFILFFTAIVLKLDAQVPVINNLSVSNGTVNQMVIISGNNFPVNAADVKVFFGSVSGSVISTSSNSIEVEVPAGTTTDNILVINTSNGLSGSSNGQFFLSYSGDNFNPALMDPEISYPSSVELLDLCLCDFDGDGKSELAATKVNTETDILIYENNSVVESISLTELNGITNPELDLASPTSNITCGDIDGDGLPDLVVSKTGNPRNVVYVLENISSSGNIQFEAALSLFLPTDEIAKRLEVKDIDFNGKPDIIVSNTDNENLNIFQNTSTGGNIQFNATPIIVPMTGAATTNGLIVEDLNGDLLPDLATCPFFGNDIFIRFNNSTPGNFSFAVIQTITVSGNLNNIAPGDFNNDGKIDMAVTKTVQNEVAVLENLTTTNSSTISFTEHILSTDGNPWGVHATDMDGDGFNDLLVALRDVNTINVFENTGNGSSISFNKHAITTTLYSRNIVGGDIDGDAKPDIAFTSFNGSPQYSLSVLRNSNCYKPVVDPLGPVTICAGSSLILSATKGVGITYTWDVDNVIIKTGIEDTIIVTQPGVYKVIAESQSGSCTEISNAVIVNPGTGGIPSDPVIYNFGPFCIGADIVLTTDSIAGATYFWQGPDNFTSSDQNISIPNASPAKAGVYSLQVSVGDCSSNVSTTTVDLITLPSFTVTANGNTKICEGGSVQLSVNQIAGYTYQWYVEGQIIPGETNPIIQAGDIGLHSVEVTQSSSSCSVFSVNSVYVDVIARPVADFYTTDPACVNNDMQFINSSTFEPGESVGYAWDFGDGSFIVNNENPTHTYAFEGSYTITFVVAYTGGTCRDTLQSPITVNPGPVFEIIKSPEELICEGSPLNLSSSTTFDRYLWNTGETSRVITVYTPGDYTLSVTDDNGCVTQNTETIDMLPTPVVSATADPDEILEDSEVQLRATGAESYLWRPAEPLDNPFNSDPIATLSETTTFIVTGTNSDGCSDTASVLVRVIADDAINVEPRNVFTPNGDGIDDEWIIEYIEDYPGAEITIYNGLGSVVYETNNYNNDWDAVYQGKDLPETAYFYVIRYESKNPKTGSVTVIR